MHREKASERSRRSHTKREEPERVETPEEAWGGGVDVRGVRRVDASLPQQNKEHRQRQKASV